MIKIQKEPDCWVLYFTPLVYIHTVNQLKRAKRDSWQIEFLNIYFDREKELDLYEVGIVILGIGLSLKINTT